MVAALTGFGLLLAGCTSAPEGAQTSDAAVQSVELSQGWDWQPQAGRLELGVTHTQESLDAVEPAAARDRGLQILAGPGAIWQGQHLMGFGTLNPEPSPGVYDWSSLDTRMRLIRDTGGRTVLTACCAPDWMKGGDPGTTDWSRLEVAPDPGHFDDFAALTALTVERYPQIERVLVWNELKGFFNDDQNRWDYEGYTALYNKVYTAVKAVRPDVQVGGPYAPVTSLAPGAANASTEVSGAWGAADQRALDIVGYWLANKVGADFIAVDGPTQSRDGERPTGVETGASKFADLTTWIRRQTSLPVWWAEFYADVPGGVRVGPAAPASTVATLAVLSAFARSGVSVAMLWGPQGSSGLDYSSLWTSSVRADGGRPTPLTAAWQWLVPRLAAGRVEVGRAGAKPLLAFRAPDGAVVVNLTGDPVETATGRDPLPAWAVGIQQPRQAVGG